jgi:hypothetical protein
LRNAGVAKTPLGIETISVATNVASIAVVI